MTLQNDNTNTPDLLATPSPLEWADIRRIVGQRRADRRQKRQLAMTAVGSAVVLVLVILSALIMHHDVEYTHLASVRPLPPMGFDDAEQTTLNSLLHIHTAAYEWTEDVGESDNQACAGTRASETAAWRETGRAASLALVLFNIDKYGCLRINCDKPRLSNEIRGTIARASSIARSVADTDCRHSMPTHELYELSQILTREWRNVVTMERRDNATERTDEKRSDDLISVLVLLSGVALAVSITTLWATGRRRTT